MNVIIWFRQDLRIEDNPALNAAAALGKVLPIYIHDDMAAGENKIGAASKIWLHQSLGKLNEQLHDHLQCFSGDSFELLKRLCIAYNIKTVLWNRCYEKWRWQQDQEIKLKLTKLGIEVKEYNAALLLEPWQVTKNDGSFYKVFTPFYKALLKLSHEVRQVLPKPTKIEYVYFIDNTKLNDLLLLSHGVWENNLISSWEVGEVAAKQKLINFLQTGLQNYKDGRNFPNKENVSMLSPHLHFGEISPHQVWYCINDIDRDSEHFRSELVWREFSYYLLYHFPELPWQNFQSKFNNFPWEDNQYFLQQWQKGQTGYPIIDAGMRQLYQTGSMHNRLRMVTASFLVKNLLVHWQHGAKWFWDCLFDADLASNSASWQWVAGSGVDAAPYFRIFNPVLQGKKFDKEGTFTKRFVPELAKLPNRYLFQPWTAPDDVLAAAGVELGRNYPQPIVDLAESRNKALDAYKQLG
jgi:deoxyribodipyrimidine photo-lyase